MLKWILIGLAVVVVLISLVAIIGAFLPRNHVASRTLRLKQPPETIWSVLTNVDAFPSWRTNIARVERLPDKHGRPVWREFDRRKESMTLECELFEPPRRLSTRIADQGLPFGGSWTWRIRPVDGGSELSVTENGEIYNPLFRFAARFVFGYTATLDGYLAALANHFGESRTSPNS